jgi:hypothetical protein
MVCREILSCPVVQKLRGPLGECRILYCETGALPCALLVLLREGKPGVAAPSAERSEVEAVASP